jgi:hypothetical protein
MTFPRITLLLDQPRTFQWSQAASSRFQNKTGMDVLSLADATARAGDLERLATLLWCGLDDDGRQALTVEAILGNLTLPTLLRIVDAMRAT